MRFSPNGGERLRRRLPALPGDGGRERLDQGGLADDADDPGRAPAARASRSPALLGIRRAPAEEPIATRADPAPPVRARSSRSSRRPTSSTPRSTGARSAGSRRASASRASRSSRSRASTPRSSSRSPGRSPGTSTASRRTRPSPVRLAERGPRSVASSRARSPSGTRTWSTTAGSSRTSRASDLRPRTTETVIYCVIPPELEAELYDKLVAYYEDNPNVTVIVDRRNGPDRRHGAGGRRVRAEARRCATAAARAHPGHVPGHRAAGSLSPTRIAAWPQRRRPSRTRSAASGSTRPAASPSRSIVPATGRGARHASRARRAADVDRAVAAAKAAFEDWRLVPAPERGNILFRFAELLRRAQGRADRPDDARDGEGAGPRPAATSRKRST